jgi:hypothetical protein
MACTSTLADCNRCVPDVVAAVSSLRDHGDVMGFHLGGFPDEVWDSYHWQGIQRLTTGGGRYLAITQSGNY